MSEDRYAEALMQQIGGHGLAHCADACESDGNHAGCCGSSCCLLKMEPSPTSGRCGRSREVMSDAKPHPMVYNAMDSCNLRPKPGYTTGGTMKSRSSIVVLVALAGMCVATPAQ